jgi:hypothetical protein
VPTCSEHCVHAWRAYRRPAKHPRHHGCPPTFQQGACQFTAGRRRADERWVTSDVRERSPESSSRVWRHAKVRYSKPRTNMTPHVIRRVNDTHHGPRRRSSVIYRGSARCLDISSAVTRKTRHRSPRPKIGTSDLHRFPRRSRSRTAAQAGLLPECRHHLAETAGWTASSRMSGVTTIILAG